MANKYKIEGGSSLLDVESDIDDYTFLNHSKQGSAGYMFGGAADYMTKQQRDEQANLEARRQMLIEETRRIQERTLESSSSSLRMVHESEQLGVSTAEELLRQKEQLENCERNLEDTSRTLRTSQKHINSIKSIFGGLKNMFSKTPEAAAVAPKPVEVQRPPTQLSSSLSQAVDTTKSQTDYDSRHPAFRLRDDDYRSPYGRDTYGVSEAQSSRDISQKVEMQLDNNLQDLSAGLGRLKGLAIGLGEEIEDQNDLLDILNEKVEDTDILVKRQNKQMKQILGK